MNKRRIVLLGVGHTHAHVMRQWAVDPLPNTELVCISKFPFATYSGMLPGTLAGQFAPDEMQVRLHPLAQKVNARLMLANVTGLDADRQTLRFSDAEPLRFDALSVGVGSMPAGWLELKAAIVVPIKPMQTFLQRLDDQLGASLHNQQASGKVIVVGGGTAGIEIALCLHARLANRSITDRFAIQIITSGGQIASELRPRSVRLLRKQLASRGIDVLTNSRVVEATDKAVITDDGVSHQAKGVIWATGAVGPPVLATLGLPTDERGFLQTRTTLQTTATHPVFAVGDAGTVVDSPSPKAGVYAVRQAPILWHNLRAILSGEPLREFHPQSDFLKILNTGDGKALLEYKWLSVHARWCMRLKTSIDKRFIAPYQLNFDAATIVAVRSDAA